MAKIAKIYALPAIVVGLDQASKWLMLGLIFNPPRSIPLLPFLSLTPAYNRGISFGLLASETWLIPLFLTLLAIGVGLGLPFYALRYWSQSPWSQLGAGLVAGGALGNAIDRIRIGQVVDFIHLYAGAWHWPIFNLADSAITLGICCILWQTWGQRRL